MPELSVYATLEAIPDAVLLCEQGGRLSFVNQRCCQMFGYTRQDLMGQEIEFLLPARFHARHRGYRDQHLQQPRVRPMGGAQKELYGRRADGSEFPVDIMLGRIQLGGQN
ncbi:MAG: hypothetical protein CVV27_20795, partial [Candidatus Melainabacteria bacterium HGW-Melainabacteria-1]